MVSQNEEGVMQTRLQTVPVAELPDGEVLIQVEYSSLNYKDALAATGRPGVVRRYPHVPGIDVAGTVAESSSDRFQPGQSVLVTGYGLGSRVWGGWSELVRAPADWVVPLPDGLTTREAISYGTAGFTAALCRLALEQHGARPDQGDILVTGASGGVGSLAVRFLAQAGFRVVAVTGKPEAHERLHHWGAAETVGRKEVSDPGESLLLSARWAGAVVVVGGPILANAVRSTKPGGCVAACGMAAGTELQLTVFPFILRGVTLAGIDSSECPMDRRIDVWNKLAGEWKLSDLDQMVEEINFSQLDEYVADILAGRIIGRVIVTPTQS
ncbi:MAG: oxidoreductase [Planctomycetales bacterium]